MSKTENLGPVLFDLDGTLVESASGIAASLDHAIAACGIRAGAIDWRRHIGPPVQRILAAVLPDVKVECRNQIIAAFREHYATTGIFMTTLFPGIFELVRAIGAYGFGPYVVTNKPQQPAEAIVRHLKLDSFVRRVVGGDPAGVGTKPDRAASLIAEEGVTGGIFIGDGLDDLYAAERIGARFFLAGWGYGTPRVLAERPEVTVLHKPSDLFSLIQTDRAIG